MIEAEIVCTDEGCAVTAVAAAESHAELELLICDDCGCIAQVLSISEIVELRPAAPVTRLRPTSRRPLAA